jgi:hypothetical protein
MASLIKAVLIGMIAAAAFAAPNLFTNAGFENGNLIGWNLSSTDYNCLADKRLQTIAGCPNDPSIATPHKSTNYVHSGNYGLELGSWDPDNPATLTQSVYIAVTGRYRVDFSFRELNYYPQTPDNSFEVVWGTSLSNLTSIYQVTDKSTNAWSTNTVRFEVTAPGTYVVGFRFNNVWGEWALDDTNLSKNPEPGTLAMLAIPLAWVVWRRRRA